MLKVLFYLLLLFMVVICVIFPMLLPCASDQWGTLPQKTSFPPQAHCPLWLGHVDPCPGVLLVV